MTSPDPRAADVLHIERSGVTGTGTDRDDEMAAHARHALMGNPLRLSAIDDGSGPPACREPLATKSGQDQPMAAIKGRKHRVGVAEYERLGARVPPELKAQAERTAAALGVSAGAYLSALLAREELDEHGRPVWWSDPVPRDQQELPFETRKEAPLKRSA
jgi:hypothetical protein